MSDPDSPASSSALMAEAALICRALVPAPTTLSGYSWMPTIAASLRWGIGSSPYIISRRIAGVLAIGFGWLGRVRLG